MANGGEIVLEQGIYEQVKQIAQALSDGFRVWGGGVGAEKRGEAFVISAVDEDGEQTLESFPRAINAAWGLVQYLPGTLTISEVR